MIYMDGDSCMYGSGIEQHLYGFNECYTGREVKQRFLNGDTTKANIKMNDIRKRSKKICDDHVNFIEENNVAAQLRKKGVQLITRAHGGSSNQAIAMRIIDAVIKHDVKKVVFCPTNITRLVYPKKKSQSLTMKSGDFQREYRIFLKKWLRHFTVTETMILEANALLGLVNFCKDNNVELLGTKTPIWMQQVSQRQLDKQLLKIIDQINEICVFDLGSDLDDDKNKFYTPCGHPNLGQHIKLADDICTHLGL